jgi:flagellar motor switch protein FliN/FliY
MSEAAQATTPPADVTQTTPPPPAQAAQAEPAPPAGQDQAVEVRQVELPEAADSPARGGAGQIDILLEATVPVTARLGQVEVQLKRLLQLGPGSVLQLDKQVGEPVELFLRGSRFATGQLVVVGDRLGVRIKEVLAPAPAGP